MFLAVGSINTAQAAEFLAPSPDGGSRNITIGSTEEHKNLYVVGGSVVINGKTLGDLYAAGGNVDVAGEVEKDAVVAAGNVTIDGKVGDDLRAAGGSIKVDAPVAGDLLAAGGNLVISEKSSVGGDASIGGGTIVLDAPVAGDLRLGGGDISINSQIKGSVTVMGANKNQHIVFGSKAEVSGKFIIYGEGTSITKLEGAKVSDPEYRPARGGYRRGGVAKMIGGAIVIKLLALILAILLVLRLFPRRAQTAINSVMSDPWSNLGIGFLGLIVIPIVAIIAAILLVGYYAAFALLAWYVLMLLLAGLVAALFVGAWIIKVLTKKPELKADWQAGVIGAVVLVLLGFIPVVGWILSFALFCMGLGALLRMAKADVKAN